MPQAQGRFRAFHDLLFENQDDLSRASLLRYAAEAELDVDRFVADLDGRVNQETVEADLALAEAHQLSGSPNTIINGVLLRGAQPYEALRTMADCLIAR